MSLPSGVIIPWDGEHASIPAGFVRETTLDGRYPKGYGAEAVNTTGGNATHTHTSPSHTHTLAGHTHSVTLNAFTGNHQASTQSGGAHQGTNHTHSASPAVNSSTIESVAVTYSAESNDPPYYEVIFIRSTANNQLPVDGIVLRQDTDRSELSHHSASAGRYFKGAATDQDAGSTGGSTTNSHTIDHDHNVQHSHSGVSGGPSPASGRYTEGPNNDDAHVSHTHNVTLNSATPVSETNSAIASQAETVEPEYRSLNAYINETAGSIALKEGDIAMWLGDPGSLPAGWVLCDGENETPDMTDRFLKLNNTPGSSTTGGSNTHTHAAQSHTHNVPSHSHSGSSGTNNQKVSIAGSGAFQISQNHSHSVSVGNATDTLESSNTTANSSNNEPEYRTVAYIMYVVTPEPSERDSEILGTLGVISGYVTLAGNPVQGATVTLIDSGTDTVVGTQETDYNGFYEFTDLAYKQYHAAVEYQDGEELYNAPSLPFLYPSPQEAYGESS